MSTDYTPQIIAILTALPPIILACVKLVQVLKGSKDDPTDGTSAKPATTIATVNGTRSGA
jgi:hypothetical protein